MGFITVLCIGNYFRAKRAQERQRQRRLAKLAAFGNNTGSSNNTRGGGSLSPSNYTGSIGTTYSEPPYEGNSQVGGYEAPVPVTNGGVRA